MSCSWGLVVEGDGNQEGACGGIVEVVDAAGTGVGGDRPAEIRLRVIAGVVGPRLEVAPGHAQIDAGEPERAPHPRLVERVTDRHLAPLHEPRVFDARLVAPHEPTARLQAGPVPAASPGR